MICYVAPHIDASLSVYRNMNIQEIKELLTGVITNLESERPQQWQPSWIEKLRNLSEISEKLQKENSLMREAFGVLIKSTDAPSCTLQLVQNFAQDTLDAMGQPRAT